MPLHFKGCFLHRFCLEEVFINYFLQILLYLRSLKKSGKNFLDYFLEYNVYFKENGFVKNPLQMFHIRLVDVVLVNLQIQCIYIREYLICMTDKTAIF